MRNASALYRFAVTMVALAVLIGGCGQAPQSPTPRNASSDGSTIASGPAGAGSAGRGQAVAGSKATPGAPVWSNPATMAPGSVYRNPANGRNEVIVADVGRTALLIGDSQSEPPEAWTRTGIAALGYKVYFCGKGGTGFVAAHGATGNYLDALQRGDWRLPYGSPPLVVVQGGGNDAAQGATDAQIIANTERLLDKLRERYPDARIVMIGTLARGANYGGGRRTEVDTLLSAFAAKHDIPFVSVGDWLTRYGLVKNLTDEVHLSGEGHRALGDLLADHLKRLGLKGPA
jgi:acyl-CoA thioesterase-1